MKYTKYYNMTKKCMKEFNLERKKFTEIQLNVCIASLMAAPNFSKNVNITNDVIRLFTESRILDGKCMYFYISDINFCTWLIECVKETVDSNLIEHFHKKYGAVCVFNFSENILYQSFAAVPAMYARNFHELKEEKINIKHNPDSDPNSMVYFYDGDNNSNFMLNKINSIDSVNKGFGFCMSDYEHSFLLFKLYAGICMYADCFPDMIKEGIPEDFNKGEFYNKALSKTILISDKIAKTKHDSPEAHYRSGHFRRLISERFTNKRFQTIFIKGCFVNGESKTIISPEEEE